MESPRLMNSARQQSVSANMLKPSSAAADASSSLAAELLDPRDYERLSYSAEVLKDSLRAELLQFPPNDITVQVVPRQLRTKFAARSDDELAALEVSTRDCIRYFVRDWLHCSRNFEHLALAGAPVRAHPPPVIAEHLYELDTANGIRGPAPGQPDQAALAALLAPVSSSDAENDAKLRSSERNTIYSYYAHMLPAPTDSRPRLAQPLEDPGSQLHVTARELKFALGDYEPLWCSLSLWDLPNRRRLSEEFSYHLNSPTVMRLLHGLPPSEAPTSCVDAIFTVDRPSPGCALVLRVDKLLTLTGAEPYARPQTLKPKQLTALQAEIAGCGERIAHHSAPLALGVLPLYRDDGSLAVGSPANITQFARLDVEQLTEDSLFAVAAALVDEKLRKKLKLLAGRAAFDVRPFSASAAPANLARINPSFFPIQPFPESVGCYAREVQPFATPDTPYRPAMVYTHSLYVYPQSLSLPNYHGGKKPRNLCVKVMLKDGDKTIDDGVITCVFGGPTGPAFVAAGRSPVLYHDRKPTFACEIKLQLPSRLSENHHLMFQFDHVVCKPPKLKQKAGWQTELPAAWLPVPLLTANQSVLADGRHQLTPYCELPPRYLSAIAHEQIASGGGGGGGGAGGAGGGAGAPASSSAVSSSSSLKRVDKRPTFTVSTRLVSTIAPRDPHINTFFVRYNSGKDDGDLLHAIEDLKLANRQALQSFLPVLLSQLLRCVAIASDVVSKASFLAIANIIAAARLSDADAGASEAHRSPQLCTFVQYVFDGVKDAPADVKPLHELLVVHFVFHIDRKTDGLDNLLRYSWFVFDLMIKAMLLRAHDDGMLSTDKTRPSRYSDAFYNDLTRLLTALIDQLHSCMRSSMGVAMSLNKSIAFLFKDLLSLADRGQVLYLLHEYVLMLTAMPDADADLLVGLKFMLLKIVVDHEHFVPLNMPLHRRMPPPSKLALVWKTDHYLLYWVLEIVASIGASKDEQVRQQGADLLHHIIGRIEHDPRWDSVAKRERIYAMFLPLLVAMVQQGSVVVGKPGDRPKTKQELQSWLWPVLHVVQSMPRALLRDWWKAEAHRSVLYFFVLLAKCIWAFEYTGSAATPAATAASSTSTAAAAAAAAVAAGLKRYEEMLDKDDDAADPLGVKQAERQNTLTRGFAKTRQITMIADPAAEQARLRVGSLTRDLSLFVLDLLADFLVDWQADLRTVDSTFLRNYFELLVLLLKKPHPRHTLSCTWRMIRTMVMSLPEPFFVHTGTYLADLTYEVLRHMTWLDNVTRNEASTMLFFLLRENQRHCRNISRMRLHTMVSLNRLVGEGWTGDQGVFRSALSGVQRNAGAHGDKPLAAEIADLCERMGSVITNSLRVLEHQHDPEMTADLYFQIATGYMDAPDLRLTWLSNLATLHTRDGNPAEASMCHIHCSALISTYLALTKPTEAIRVDRAAFKRLSPTIDVDLTVPVGITGNEGICQIQQFSRSGLFAELNAASNLLHANALYESAIDVLRFLAAVYSNNRSFAKMEETFGKLYSLAEKIVESNRTQARLFYNYYLVTFSGADVAPHVHGHSYIYKEDAMVRLGDITDRLRTQYGNKLGASNIVVLSPAKDITKEPLKAGSLAIQIVSLQPYYEPRERLERPTLWEQHFNVRRFIYSVPFTQSGKAHGDMAEQYQRKTILSVDEPFPTMRKRVRVTGKEEIILDPIENALELLDGRVLALNNEVMAATPNTKTLQINLQGALLLQVNAGPLEIGRVFLSDASQNPKKVESLRELFLRFVEACASGVMLNKRLIGPDQLELQVQLEMGFEDMKKKLASMGLDEERMAKI